VFTRRSSRTARVRCSREDVVIWKLVPKSHNRSIEGCRWSAFINNFQGPSSMLLLDKSKCISPRFSGKAFAKCSHTACGKPILRREKKRKRELWANLDTKLCVACSVAQQRVIWNCTGPWFRPKASPSDCRKVSSSEHPTCTSST
jgi:hypothetical protein